MHIIVNSFFTMFDGKMLACVQGTGGAYCQMCLFSKSSCHSIEQATNGFPIDRNIENMYDIFKLLSNDGEQPIVKKPGDYETRAGVTAEPITKRDLNKSA